MYFVLLSCAILGVMCCFPPVQGSVKTKPKYTVKTFDELTVSSSLNVYALYVILCMNQKVNISQFSSRLQPKELWFIDIFMYMYILGSEMVHKGLNTVVAKSTWGNLFLDQEWHP